MLECAACGWTIEVVAGKRRTPIGEEADEASAGDVHLHLILSGIRQAEPSG
jgi:hypothetical protein